MAWVKGLGVYEVCVCVIVKKGWKFSGLGVEGSRCLWSVCVCVCVCMSGVLDTLLGTENDKYLTALRAHYELEPKVQSRVEKQCK